MPATDFSVPQHLLRKPPEKPSGQSAAKSLYTPEQRARRDGTRWTLVQGILAPVQFVAFLVSAWLVLRYLQTGEGAVAATVSVLIKTALLYTIMVTGCIWERVVFGQYLFAPAFFWEDAVSMVVIALHTMYLVLFLTGLGSLELQFKVALAAYLLYAINAAQFIWKLRQARLAGNVHTTESAHGAIEAPATERVATDPMVESAA